MTFSEELNVVLNFVLNVLKEEGGREMRKHITKLGFSHVTFTCAVVRFNLLSPQNHDQRRVLYHLPVEKGE